MVGPIHVVATRVAKPSQEGELGAALSAIVPSVRNKPGCIRYDLHRDIDALDRFVMIETWHDTAALETHTGADAFRALAARFDTLLLLPPDIVRLRHLV